MLKITLAILRNVFFGLKKGRSGSVRQVAAKSTAFALQWVEWKFRSDIIKTNFRHCGVTFIIKR